MKKSDVLDLVSQQLMPAFNKELKRTRNLEVWARDGGRKPVIPRTASREHKALADLSLTPWLGLLPRVSNQMLFMNGCHSDDRSHADLAAFWRPWLANGMRSRQSSVYNSALSYGLGYASVKRSKDGRAAFRVFSPAQMLPVYADPEADEFPMYAIIVETDAQGRSIISVMDETKEYLVGQESRTAKPEFIVEEAHGFNVCPIVRYAEDLDTEGRSPGEIERLLTVGSRINKTVYDRLLIQHNNSWKVRTATGLEDTDQAGGEERKLKIGNDTVLTGAEGVQFGTLDETSVEPLIKAHDSDLEDLSAVSQTPMTALGKMINVGSEGVAEVKSGLRAKTRLHKETFGDSNVRLLRLAAFAEGRFEDAQDYSIEGKWADLEIETLAQAVDAYGKAATMLNIPPQMLWGKIPTITPAEAESFKKYANENPSPAMIEAQALASQFREAP